MFKACFYKQGKKVDEEIFEEPFMDYKEDLKRRFQKKEELSYFDFLMENIMIKGYGVKKEDLGNLKRLLRHYDEVGISTDIYDYLCDNKDGWDVVVFGTEEAINIIEFKNQI